MPQFIHPLPDLLSAPRRETLRELFLHEVSLVSCVLWKNPAPWRLDWRRCHDTFLLFPLRGAFRVRLRGQAFVVRPGGYLLLPDDTPHELELVRGHRELWQISLHCHLLDRWRRSLMSRVTHFHGALADPAETHRLLNELVCLMERDPATAQEYGAMVVRQLLAAHLLRRPLESAPAPAGDERVRLALERMEAEFGSAALSVEELARAVHLTAVRFRQLFRAETGESPKQFLQALRLRHAVRRLAHTTESVKEVAARCGFASDHYFHLAFRRKFGCTPSQYRLGPPL